jgi:predicted DNA-binding protein (UPF0251 family)
MSERGINLEEYVDNRLYEWGKWTGDTGIPRLFYSRISNVAAILEFTGKTSRKNSQGSDSDQADETERWILSLMEVYPKESEAIILYYSSRGTHENIASTLKVSRRTFRRRVESGIKWIGENCLKSSVTKINLLSCPGNNTLKAIVENYTLAQG